MSETAKNALGILNVKDLTEYVFRNFNERTGEPKAFFEIPQRHGDSIRVAYVSYVGRGEDKAQLIDWMLDIFIELKRLGGVHWFWRLAEMITLKEDKCSACSQCGRCGWQIRTRIAVLDAALIDIRLTDELHAEGAPIIEINI